MATQQGIDAPRTSADAMFAVVDRRDADGFAALCAEDAVLRFANAEPVRGRAAIRDSFATFFASIAGLEHDIVGFWHADGAFVAESLVTYTRTNRTTVTLPAVSIVRRGTDGLIRDYRIYMDLGPLYE
jgi:ketosteroid isomerase-like protein